MNIQGIDYNTDRKKLLLPEYGREIQKMVDYALTLPTKEERQQCAASIVRLMETKLPHIKDNENYKQTLWDHLYLMSDKALDIDWPYDVSEAESIHGKPVPLKIPGQNRNKYSRYYGKLLEALFAKLKTMDEGPERDKLAQITANQMRLCLTTWGLGYAGKAKIVADLAEHTDGIIQLDADTLVLPNVPDTQNAANTRKRKKTS